MEKLEFRPTKILLVFWLLGVLFACLPIGGIVTAACMDAQVHPAKAFAIGYLIWVFTPSTGMSTPEEKLVGIPNPHDMKQTIVDRAEGSRQPRATAIENAQAQSSGEVVALLTEIRNSLQSIEAKLSLHKD